MTPVESKTKRTPKERERLIGQLVEDGWSRERAEIEADVSETGGEADVTRTRQELLVELLEDGWSQEEAEAMAEKMTGGRESVRLTLTF